MYNEGPKTFQLGTGGGIRNRLVKLAAALVVLNSDSPADDPIGSITGMDGDGVAGDFAAVKFLKDNGTQELEAASAVNAGGNVFALAAGRVGALPFDPEDINEREANTAYVEGDLMVPATPNGHIYVCTADGTSHETVEPTWPTDDSEVTDGTAKWKVAGYDKYKKVGKALQAASGAGSIIEVLPYDWHSTVSLI